MNDNSMLERRAAAAGGVPADIKFKVILRTKLHKNMMYDDEAWAEEHVYRGRRNAAPERRAAGLAGRAAGGRRARCG